MTEMKMQDTKYSVNRDYVQFLVVVIFLDTDTLNTVRKLGLLFI